MSVTVTCKLIAPRDLRRYFALDSPGYYIAKEAPADVIRDAASAIELIVLGNKLFAHEYEERVIAAIAHYHGEDAVRTYSYLNSDSVISEFELIKLGHGRLAGIIRDSLQAVRQQLGAELSKASAPKANKSARMRRG